MVVGTTPAGVDWHARALALRPVAQAWIGGRYVDAVDGRTFDDVSPVDGRLLARVAAGGAADINRAVVAARAVFDAGTWRRQHPRHRKSVLLRWAHLVREHAEELALLETLDMGKPISESLRVDAESAATCLQWYGETVDKLYGEVAPTDTATLALVEREPLGVVGAVVPWNYPLIIAAWKIGPAIAAGNSVVLKPAEQSPLSALLLARLAAEAGLPDGVLNVVPGLGPTAGAALGRHPGVDKIAFTGSEEIGRMFLRYAAESNLKPVSLELGGKSPQVVFADTADLDAAAEAVALGIFYNQGQTCNAGSRLLAERSIAADLVAAVARHARSLAPGDPLDTSSRLGALVSREHLRRVLAYVETGQREGAHLVTGGHQVRQETGGAYMEPTVLDGAHPDMVVANEEIFGPVLVCLTFDTEEEAVRLANGTDYGLAAAVWTSDLRRAHRVARALQAGTVWVNTFDASDITTPFGGFKRSGSGRDKSLHALAGYTQLKTTWIALSR